jgi:hypothetical protein
MKITQGQQFNIVWQVVAADGAGPVTVTLDTTGGQVFTGASSVAIPITGTAPPGVGTFTFSAVAPKAVCTGKGATCTIQMKSSSNWYSCSTIQIIDPNNPNATASPTLPPNCQPAFGLTFCDWMNGQNVYLPTGQISAVSLDHVVQSAYTQYLSNPLIFKTPGSSQCQGWFKKLICGINFQPCNAVGTGGCLQACLNTRSFCSTDDSHLSLYQCSNFTNTISDLTGNCNGAGSVSVSVIVMLASAVLMVVALL